MFRFFLHDLVGPGLVPNSLPLVQMINCSPRVLLSQCLSYPSLAHNKQHYNKTDTEVKSGGKVMQHEASQANIQTVAITAFQLYLNSTRRTMKSFCYSKKLGSYFHNIIIHQLLLLSWDSLVVERRNRFTKQVI